MAKAMIEAYDKEIKALKDKIFKDYGRKLYFTDLEEEHAYHVWVAQHIRTGVIHGLFFDKEKSIKFQDESKNITSIRREIA